MPRKERGAAKINLHLPEHLLKVKRGPQALLPKDIGMIACHSDIDRDSIVVDAGFGSGFVSISLARFVKEVHAYELREDFHKQGLKNIARSGMGNIRLELKDVKQGLEQESEVDLVVLDLPEPEPIIPLAASRLSAKGKLVCVLPTVEQVKRAVKICEDNKLTNHVVETSVREWRVSDNASRPMGLGLIHSCFLVFVGRS